MVTSSLVTSTSNSTSSSISTSPCPFPFFFAASTLRFSLPLTNKFEQRRKMLVRALGERGRRREREEVLYVNLHLMMDELLLLFLVPRTCHTVLLLPPLQFHLLLLVVPLPFFLQF